MTHTSQTLAQRIAGSPIAIPEAVHIATQVAERLRHFHDSGSVHGGLTTETVAILGGAVELLPPQGVAGLSAYDAPEVRMGGAPDARSDIFSFGALLFEMVTGRQAFDVVVDVAGTPQCGSPALDRLIGSCVALSPDSRYQQAQKLILELRVLNAAARRGSIPPPAATPLPPLPRPSAPVAPPPPAIQPAPVASAPAPTAWAPPAPPSSPSPAPADGSSMRALQDLEGRISTRMQEQERTIASVAHVANEVLKALREQQANVYAAPAPPRPAPVQAPEPPLMRGMGYRGYEEPMFTSGGSRSDKMLDLLSEKLSRLDMLVSSAVERVQKLEQIFDQFDIDAAALRDSVTRDIRKFETALKAQSSAIESARTAMSQTDDLVERVVEAIDSLQAMFVSSAEEQTLAS